MRRLKTPLNPSLIIAVFYSEHAPDDFLLGLIVRAMIKCSRSLLRQDNTRVSFKRKSRYLDFSEVGSRQRRWTRRGRLDGRIKQGMAALDKIVVFLEASCNLHRGNLYCERRAISVKLYSTYRRKETRKIG